MNACQLSFNEEPKIQQIHGMWQAIGSLTVYDREYKNTFRVFVSGKTENIVQEFIDSQQINCINLAVVSDKVVLADSDTTFADTEYGLPPCIFENTHETILDGSQLNIGIARLHIQTPPPYKIIYSVAMTPQLAGDNNIADFSFNPPVEPVPGESPWTESVSFEIPEAQVHCRVTQGSVEVKLEERVGDTQKVHGPIKVKDECWLPENRTIAAKDCVEKKWRVIVNGIERGTECYITYERRVVN